MESSEYSQEEAPGVGRSRLRRRLAVVAVLVLLVVALAVTPPLINVNRLQKRIAANMSESLGRPVHLDSVTLHLLPVPGFTLENLVVSEDPAFGSEPVIRANEVEATLRPSSLWRQQVEISSIRFIEPSLNLVRNAQGRWNLESLLMHASRVDTAPTAQRKAGPAPRFPYIEATGGRVNLKLGVEKMPFSLTEADFALWLPSPQQWRVRLEAKPARTDTNVSDPGTVRVEGALERAATMAEVPVDLRASWRDAPLGEASRLLTGDDEGWRGMLHLDAAVTGTLGAAKLQTRLTLNDLRRADFVPAQSLDLRVDCTGTLVVPTATVQAPACALGEPKVTAVADRVDLTGPGASGLQLGSPGIPEAWLMEWARLFSQRIPEEEHGRGVVSGSLAMVAAHKGEPARWQGTLNGDMGELVAGVAVEPGMDHAPFSVLSSSDGLVLLPLNLMPPGKAPPLLLSATASRDGYTLRLTGTATAAQLRSLIALAPPLGDGLNEALPWLHELASEEAGEATDDAAKPMSVDFTCSRAWNSLQTCVAAAPVVAPAKAKSARRRRR